MEHSGTYKIEKRRIHVFCVVESVGPHSVQLRESLVHVPAADSHMSTGGRWGTRSHPPRNTHENTSRMQQLLARHSNEYGWLSGGSLHNPTLKPSEFQWTILSDGRMLSTQSHTHACTPRVTMPRAEAALEAAAPVRQPRGRGGGRTARCFAARLTLGQPHAPAGRTPSMCYASGRL